MFSTCVYSYEEPTNDCLRICCSALLIATTGPLPQPAFLVSTCFETGGRQPTPAYRLSNFSPGHTIPGPALLIDEISTIVLEPKCTAHITADHNVRIELPPPAGGIGGSGGGVRDRPEEEEGIGGEAGSSKRQRLDATASAEALSAGGGW